MAMPPLTKEEIKEMQKVCKLAARTLEYVAPYIMPGISTNEIDKIVEDFTLRNGAKSGPLGYHGYPKSICTSINDVICHGLPDETILKNGDIINVDVSPVLNGFFGDTSATFYVGEVSQRAKDITEAAKEAMMIGIEAIRPRGTTGDIGFAVDKFSTRKGYATIKEIGGHGIGKVFHDEPFVPSFGKKGRGDILVPWRCITVEPMLNENNDKMTEFDIAGTTIKYYKTVDGSLSAQFEHTVLVTDTGYDILTLP